MGTVYYECGCYITTGMGFDQHTYMVWTCTTHAKHPKIQELLKKLAEELREVTQR